MAFGQTTRRMERSMKNTVTLTPTWSTASFGHTTETSPMELSVLGAHLDLCQGQHGRLLTLQIAAQRLHGFISARFVTTLVALLILVLGFAYLVL